MVEFPEKRAKLQLAHRQCILMERMMVGQNGLMDALTELVQHSNYILGCEHVHLSFSYVFALQVKKGKGSSSEQGGFDDKTLVSHPLRATLKITCTQAATALHCLTLFFGYRNS